MGRAQRYEVEFADGRIETVTIDGRDLMAYEEATGDSALDLIAGGRKMGTWYRAAWAGMRRQGLFDGPLGDFQDQVTFVLPVADGDPTGPDTRKEDSGS